MHFGHAEAEAEFFLFLLLRERAATQGLCKRFDAQLERIRSARFDLKRRLNVSEELSAADQSVYYSAWHYAAIHVAASLPDCNRVNAIAARLPLQPAAVAAAVDFLVGCGLLEQTPRASASEKRAFTSVQDRR